MEIFGNIYGVYDMVGARREYVMISTSESNIFLDSSNSGFNGNVDYRTFSLSGTITHFMDAR